ncbi:hypothetical protein EDWATA_00125 [Edwardsiella tarda ATCC 23685]|uniref:Uncharacterized protein n=1 Tax=Edwardsiella tarda ATCC 23685 TaxID=500638 RepID=D4F0A2_EDWTA|nr:hypothetical protein EDWATA_00125 [Edwardsiella tarda ATCC 23685]
MTLIARWGLIGDRTQGPLFCVFHGFKLSATCIYSQQNCINEQGAE